MTGSPLPLVSITRPLPEALLSPLRALAQVRTAATDAPDDLAALLRDAQYALVVPPDRIDATLLAACPRLHQVITVSAGFDHIDLGACSARGVRVANTPGAVVAATADMAFGLLLAASRRIVEADAYVRAGRWTASFPPLLGQDVHHKCMGILGLGRIGAELAKRARGFDMQVIYHKRERLAPGEEASMGVRHVGFDELLACSDALMVQVPYSPATHHLIGAPELARMKPTSVLVNAARGGVVDDAALAAALRTGRLAAAGLDVVEGEPDLLPALRELPNVVLSPHLGSATRETHQRMVLEAFANLTATLQGQPLAHCLHPAPAPSS